ncbi:hypothetical protein BOS5A_200128 [Bosea sp. EC-HK365B]|nr:hypothetical protein BOSE21B_100130 [Bosea sp. 21B]CAD5286087.1 hypothetical protein BOSE7B_41398 [Bosea sp. 7B]VVT57502.1 hypothetical protein BOS5A_200128 [Bosea sp. EC-HK365B]VXC93975.1 hypothetical protein BOSE127_80184 [Bosea sp. 127]
MLRPIGVMDEAHAASGFHTQPLAAFGLDGSQIEFAASAAGDALFPGLLEPAQLLGFLFVMFLEQAQRLPHDLAGGGIAAGLHLRLDEAEQFLRQRHVDVHGRSPIVPVWDRPQALARFVIAEA